MRHHLVWQSFAKSQLKKKGSAIDFPRNWKFFIFHIMFGVSPHVTIMLVWQLSAKSQFQKKIRQSIFHEIENYIFFTSCLIFHLMWQSWDITSYDSLPQNRSFKKSSAIHFPQNWKLSIFHIMFDVSSHVTVMRHHLVWQPSAKSQFQKKIGNRFSTKLKISIFHIMFDVSPHVIIIDSTSCNSLLQNHSLKQKCPLTCFVDWLLIHWNSPRMWQNWWTVLRTELIIFK